MRTEVPLLRSIAESVQASPIHGTEVNLLRAIVKALGGKDSNSYTEVQLLRSIVRTYGITPSSGTEVQLLRQWAAAVGAPNVVGTEVQLLRAIAENISGGGPQPPADPLAGLVTPFRFETFYTFDPSVNPLYQDTACTIPAVADGATVQGVFDHLTNNAIQADQSNSMKAATLRLVNGLPILRFDGVDDWMSALPLGSIGGVQTYWCLLKSNTETFNSFWSPIETVLNISDNMFGFFRSGEVDWYSSPTSVSKNGIALNPLDSFAMGVINQWMVLKVVTRNAIPYARGIGQTWGSFFGSFDLADLIFDDPAMSDEIAAYLEAKRVLLSA